MPRSVLRSGERVLDDLRHRITRAATGPFAHAPYPLAQTLGHRGDPGLFGPDSVSWRLMGDIATMVGGLRALLIQAAHPEVVAGVGDHSRYREDPLGRLSRTSAYVTATTYGAMPEVERAVATVRRIHVPVVGVSSRGVPYDAAHAGFSAWVHNALTDSFLTANQVYGSVRLSPIEADRFVEEQTRVGALLGADPMPTTRDGLAQWLAEHPDIGPSPEMADAVDFLTDPPLDRGLKLGYRLLLDAAVATIPDRIRIILGLRRRLPATMVGRSTIGGLRWALGYSPSWKLALIRVGAPVPPGLFRQDPLGSRV
jgi:uncharacterized protein (DUF2236 family)